MTTLSRQEIEEIATQANDYDNWITTKKFGDEPAFPLSPYIVRALCDLAPSALDGVRDGERYRWLRDNSNHKALYGDCGMEGDDTQWMYSHEQLDSAIDTAMIQSAKGVKS